MPRADALPVLMPDWPAPATVVAFTTTRRGGCSAGAYTSLNLADHVGDDPENVRRNRERLRTAFELPGDPVWLAQEHGTRVIDAATATAPIAADGAFVTRPGVVLAVLTADCVPILLCDTHGSRVAALHAGWRGLLDGIIANGVAALGGDPADLLAWIGPAISAERYPVRADMYQRFLSADPANERFFSGSGDHWTFDLGACCAARLRDCGVGAVHHSGRCTWAESQSFYSYRRDSVTGRMASVIWRRG